MPRSLTRKTRQKLETVLNPTQSAERTDIQWALKVIPLMKSAAERLEAYDALKSVTLMRIKHLHRKVIAAYTKALQDFIGERIQEAGISLFADMRKLLQDGVVTALTYRSPMPVARRSRRQPRAKG